MQGDPWLWEVVPHLKHRETILHSWEAMLRQWSTDSHHLILSSSNLLNSHRRTHALPCTPVTQSEITWIDAVAEPSQLHVRDRGSVPSQHYIKMMCKQSHLPDRMVKWVDEVSEIQILSDFSDTYSNWVFSQSENIRSVRALRIFNSVFGELILNFEIMILQFLSELWRKDELSSLYLSLSMKLEFQTRSVLYD